MHGGINPHWNPVGIFAGDLFVDLEQISIAFADCFFTEPFDCFDKIEINAATARPNTPAFVANFLGRAR